MDIKPTKKSETYRKEQVNRHGSFIQTNEASERESRKRFLGRGFTKSYKKGGKGAKGKGEIVNGARNEGAWIKGVKGSDK